MHNRRRFIQHLPLALTGGALLTASLRTAWAQPKYTVSTEQLQQAVAEKFPMRYPVAGLLELSLQAPRLRMLPGEQRIGSDIAITAGGPAIGQPQTGNVDLDFKLRYEPTDKTLRATAIRINALRLPNLDPQTAQLLGSYAKSLAAQSVAEVTLHKLRPEDLQLAEVMGLQPGPIVVTEGGLRVEFVNKP